MSDSATSFFDKQAALANWSKVKDAGSYAFGEAVTLKDFLVMDSTTTILVILAAVSGVAALANTYDVLSNISESVTACENGEPLKSELDTKFWVVLAVSIVGLFFGLVLAWFLRKQKSKVVTVIVVTIIVMSLLGLLYSIQMRLGKVSSGPRLLISWSAFIIFLIAAIVVSFKKKTIPTAYLVMDE